MFDIGFWELMIIGVVVLLVVGPERMPKVAYTAGKWLGKGRSMLQSVKSEIDKEMKAEELKEILEKQKKQLNPLEEVIEETTDTMRTLRNETDTTMSDTEKTLGSSDESYPQFGDSTETSSGDRDSKGTERNGD